jgi:dCTP deaminase
MLLSDIDIKKAIEAKKIVIKPKPNYETALAACSLDLRLNNEFQTFKPRRLFAGKPFFDTRSTKNTNLTKTIVLKNDEPFILSPGEFALASTLEWLELPPDIAGRLEGRSSLGRLGIVVHSTAALIHPGIKGRIVLELGNHAPISVALYPGMRVCSVSFEQLTQPAAKPYSGKYMHQKGTLSSRISQEN